MIFILKVRLARLSILAVGELSVFPQIKLNLSIKGDSGIELIKIFQLDLSACWKEINGAFPVGDLMLSVKDLLLFRQFFKQSA